MRHGETQSHAGPTAVGLARVAVMGILGTAVVTGASAGIGEVYARRLAERGYDLVLVARRAGRLEALAAELGGEALVADLAAPADLHRVADRVAADDVTMLVNNAGINGYGPFHQADPDLLAKVVTLNVTAPTLLARAAVPGMLARGRGALVNVASLLAFAGSLPPDPLPYRATYAGTKGYVVTFTRTLAAELAGTDVRVQVCCPGYTATEFHLTAGEAPVPDAVAAAKSAEPPHAMSAEDVVTASLAGLDAGEVVVTPGLEDPSALDLLTAAEAEFRTASRPVLATRYRR
jgi:short-subunit dehydrogenase